ncbi:MAG: transposase [Caldilineaceae bacterium]
MSQALVVGVDMAKLDFAATSRVGESETILDKFTNALAGYEQLHNRLKQECVKHGLTQIHLIIEATGVYEAGLLVYAYEHDWWVSMRGAHWAPKVLRDWAKGAGYRAKTDRVDGRVLAHYGVERRPPLRPQLAIEVMQLDTLLKRRLDLEQALQKEETRLSELTGRPRVLPAVTASLRQVIAALTSALDEIQAAIDGLCQSYEPFQQNLTRLLALPGVGLKVVLPLMVKLFQWQTMTSGQGGPEGLTAFIGLDPQPYESGGGPLGAVRKHPSISKMGDNELRRLLYMGALGGVRGNNPLKFFYQRLLGRGKAKKVALVAAARKILVWAWTLFSRQVDWNSDFNQIGA